MLFISNEKRHEKIILNLFKIKGVPLSESDKKNIKNIFSGKHKASPTTLKIISRNFKKLADDDKYKEKIDKMADCFYKTYSVNYLNIIESGYEDFFRAAKSEDCFLYNEIKYIIMILRSMESLVKYSSDMKTIESIDEKAFKSVFLESKLLSGIDIGVDTNNDLLIVLNQGEGSVSLNLLLYLLACIDWKINDEYVIQKIIDNILLDMKKASLKPSFAYYTDLWKHFGEVNDEIICKALNIDSSLFYRYKSGSRPVSINHIKVILERESAVIYAVIVFLRNFISQFIINDEIKRLIEIGLLKYPEHHKVALLRFEEYNLKKQQNT